MMLLSLLWSLLKRLSLTQWLVVASLAIITTLSLQVVSERNARERAEMSERIAVITALNTEAQHDTTKKYTSDTIRSLQKDLVVHQRLIIQEKQRQLKLDEQLGQLTLANYKLRLTVDSLSAQLTGITRNDGDSLRASFDLKQPPYQINADVALPLVTVDQTGMGRLMLNIKQDPLSLNVKVGCREEVRNGVRPAQLSVVSPSYVNVTLDSLTQSEEVCSPIPPKKQRSTLHKVWSSSKQAALIVGAFFLGRGTN